MDENKKETPPRQQEEPQAKDHDPIISESKQIVNPDAKTWLADMRREKELRVRQVVPVIHARYSKFDEALYSKIERPDEYGVALVKEAEKAVRDAFDYHPASRAHRADNRTLPCRIQFRLSEYEYRSLQTALIAFGYETFQEWGRAMALRFIKETEGMA